MDVIVIIQLLFYCLVVVVGFIGNCATVLAIRSYSALASTLEQTTLTLIILQSVCDLFVCCFVVPIRIANTIAGRSWPFSDGIVCDMFWYGGYPATFVSVWIMLNLALTRVCAVFWPFKYETWLNKKVVRWTLYIFPWIISYTPMIVAGLRGSIDTSPGNDKLELCDVNPKSAQMVREFQWLMITVTYLEVFTPLTVGGLIYVLTFIKLYLQYFGKTSGQVHPSTAIAACVPGNSPAVCTPPTANTKERRLRGVKVIAIAYLAHMACVYPRQILAGLIRPEPRPPVLYALVDVLFFFSFMLSPLMYLLTMSEMRQAYKKIFNELRKCPCVKH